jgi:hypothetical protein
MATDNEPKEISRRSFMKQTAISGAGLVIASDILGPDLSAGLPKTESRSRQENGSAWELLASGDGVPACYMIYSRLKW